MESQKFRPFIFRFFALASLIIAFSSCNKNDDTEPDPTERENQAFYDHMKDWYYWNNEIPDIDISNYGSIMEVMEAIRYTPLDRWSYITDLDSFLAYMEESKFVGHGLSFSYDAQGELRVNFVYKTTNLYESGVRRSWIIREINGTTITPGLNISGLLGNNTEGVTNDFVFEDQEGNLVEINDMKQEIIMNTVLHHEIISLDDMNIGYIVLQGFTEPTEEELKTVFSEFAQQDIDELILDLRYNGGGATSIANSLASMIGGDMVQDQTFSKYVFNDVQAEENNQDEPFNEVETMLNINRLITIATHQTASASELVINGLKPFLPVTIVGDNTHGKPVGMLPFSFQELAIVAINFRIDNANGEGEYFDGLPVDIPADDDLTRRFGDTEEASLKQALEFIQTGTVKSASATEIPYQQPYDQLKGLRQVIGAY
ncbi:MAG: S41 family peptidase [Bacteroidales bacterium]